MAQPKRQDPRAKQQAAAKQLRYTIISRMAKALQKEFSLVANFKLGYRNKEDISTLPPYVLVVGSQNVLTNTSEQIVVRNGYQLDGPAGNQNTYGIDSGYDFNTHSLAGIQNLRKWGTNLEMRYVNPSTKAVTWLNIWNTLNAANIVNFTPYWDVNDTKNVLLFVNGDQKVYRWTGASASYASSTSNSITVSGATSLANLNFDDAGNIVIDGVTYAYTSAGVIGSTTYSQAPTNNKVSTTTQWNSQSFTTGASAAQILKASVVINSSQVSTITANFVAAIYTNNAGVPGTLIGSQVGSIPASFSSGDFTVNFTFNQTISPATVYHLVIYCLSSDGVNTLSAYTGASSGVGTNFSTNNGVTWTTQNGFLNATITENDSNLQTFNGVTPVPSGISVGDAIVAPPIVATTAVTGMTLPSNDLIGTLRNQIYYGSFTSSTVYITKINSFSDASFSTPRVVGEGASVNLDAPPVAFMPQSDGMYISAKLNFWYRTKFTLSSTLADESFEIDLLKTSSNQGAVSQAYVSKFKNSIVYISFENIFNALGPVKNILADPQIVNMSDSIKNDMNAYNFLGVGGSSYYFNYNIYFSVPAQGVVRIYNVNNKYWEAPQTMPVGFFYEVNGSLYGHDATTNQSYQLFVPNLYRDNGTPTNAVAAFPYVSAEGAQANQIKFFNKHYTEGYIAGNTTVTLQFNYDFGAFNGSYSVGISGGDKRIVFSKLTDGSLGTDTLGNQPAGTILNLPNQPPIPKFRIVNTFTPTNSYEVQTIFSSYNLDANWAILRFGPAIGPARDTQAGIQE